VNCAVAIHNANTVDIADETFSQNRRRADRYVDTIKQSPREGHEVFLGGRVLASATLRHLRGELWSTLEAMREDADCVPSSLILPGVGIKPSTFVPNYSQDRDP
jgi:hypothetical protein